jgi:hypothetical protein
MDQNCIVSDEDWDLMKGMISTHIDSIPTNVTVESLRKRGSLECIAQQIKRGDDNPSARLQSWYLAMLEIEVTSRPLGLQKINYLFNRHSKSKVSFVLDTTMAESSADDDEEWKRRSIVARLEGKANLSVVERQELWQAKKESRATLMRQQEEAKATRERKMSAPDLTKSRKSYSKPQRSGQKRSNDDGYLSNITNQGNAHSKTKRIKTDSKTGDATKQQASRRQSIL